MTTDALNTVLYELAMSLHGLLATQRHLLFRVSHPGFKDMVATHADDYRNALGVISQCQSRLENTMQSLIHQKIASSSPQNALTGMYCSPSLNRIATNIADELDNEISKNALRPDSNIQQAAEEDAGDDAGDDI